MVLLTALTPDNKEIFLLKPSRNKAPAQFFSSKSFQKTYPNCKPYTAVSYTHLDVYKRQEY